MSSFAAIRSATAAIDEIAKATGRLSIEALPTIDPSILDAMKGVPDDYLSRVELAKLAGAMPEPGVLEQLAELQPQLDAWDEAVSAHARADRERAELIGSTLAQQAAEHARLLDGTLSQFEDIRSPALDSYYRMMEHDFRETRERMLRGSDMAAELVESINRRSADSWTVIQQTIDSVSRVTDFARIRESLAFDAIEEQMRTLRESWDRDVRAWHDMDSLAGSVASMAELLRSSEITAHAGALAVNGFEIDRQELEQFLAGEDALREIRLEKLAELIAAQKDPRRQATYVAVLLFLLQMLVQFVVGIASSKTERAWSEGASQRKNAVRTMRSAVEQRASRAIDKGVPLALLARYRLVTASKLIVRSKPTRDSRPLGVLQLGDVVLHVSTVKRSWALVEWVPEGDDLRVRGWVFARYLDKLRLPRNPPTELASDPQQDLEPVACH